MFSPALCRFSAACGLVLGLSIAVAAVIQLFAGESAGSEALIGVGAAFGGPAVVALHLRQSDRSGRFGAVAFAVNIIGLALFTCVAYALNLVYVNLTDAQVDAVNDGLTGVLNLIAALIFVVGTVLFGVSMVRTGVLPRVPALLYTVTFPLLALLAPLPDSIPIYALHVLAGSSIIALARALWPSPSSAEPAGRPDRSRFKKLQA
jgi:hypothetical protein